MIGHTYSTLRSQFKRTLGSVMGSSFKPEHSGEGRVFLYIVVLTAIDGAKGLVFNLLNVRLTSSQHHHLHS